MSNSGGGSWETVTLQMNLGVSVRPQSEMETGEANGAEGPGNACGQEWSSVALLPVQALGDA